MNNLNHYQREMRQIAQDAGRTQGKGHWVAWLMMIVGVVVTGTMTYALTHKGMASSRLWWSWVDLAAFLPTVLLEGSALALVYGLHHWFRSEEQRRIANTASWVIWGLLAITSVVHFAFGSTTNATTGTNTAEPPGIRPGSAPSLERIPESFSSDSGAVETVKGPRVDTEGPKSRKSKMRPLTPDGFEARPRNNRWQLFRLHGKKLSANGKSMWRRTYIGSFTTEGLNRFYEREQQRLEDQPVGQRANVVNLSDRKRSGRDVERGTERARKAHS
jgi:uncharacterized membrane protein YidH (DUF202 family)